MTGGVPLSLVTPPSDCSTKRPERTRRLSRRELRQRQTRGFAENTKRSTPRGWRARSNTRCRRKEGGSSPQHGVSNRQQVLSMVFWRPGRRSPCARRPGVRQADGELPRALPVLVAAGSKRLAVQNQVVVESGSFQICRTSEAAEAGQIQIRNSTRPT